MGEGEYGGLEYRGLDFTPRTVERGSLSCKRLGKCRVCTREEKSHTVAWWPVRNFDILSATDFPTESDDTNGSNLFWQFCGNNPRSQPLS